MSCWLKVCNGFFFFKGCAPPGLLLFPPPRPSPVPPGGPGWPPPPPPPRAAHEAWTPARRYGGHDALAEGVVDHAVDEDAVRSTAVDLARSHVAVAGPTLGTIKTRMYGSALETLRDKENPLG